MLYFCTMFTRNFAFFITVTAFVLASCDSGHKKLDTPWGTTIGEDSIAESSHFSVDDMLASGELIAFTLSGPETYYDYHGHGMGTHYLLCENFTQRLGVTLRVEVCKDTAEMISKLKDGDGDLIAFPLPKHFSSLNSQPSSLRFCGAYVDSLNVSWAVREGNEELARMLDQWFKPELFTKIKQQETFALSNRAVTRHVYAPMLNRSRGLISHYDHLFKKYSPVAHWDWRLLAALSYQESTFDPQAHSWAGACGLMQIMPGTAAHLGLPLDRIYDPEANIAAACRYIAELQREFYDVRNRDEQYNFVLASYNGGVGHVRDAMALARKNGANPYLWADVSEYILKLRLPEYYTDPVVKHGYMRGTETYEYVTRVRNRWQQYQSVAR